MQGERIVGWFLRLYWRWSRPVTLGAQGCILDGKGRVLLIRHTYRRGWHFPGGGVERHESALTALKREIDEEAGVHLLDQPHLHGLFVQGKRFPGDHIALFIVNAWRQTEVPKPNREIAEQRFFPLTDLPVDINPPTARRLAEIVEGRKPDEFW